MSGIRALLYDPRADYHAGQLLYLQHPVYGASLCRVKERQDSPGGPRIELDFFDADFNSRWLAARSTPFWAVNRAAGRVRPPRVLVEYEKESILSEARKRPVKPVSTSPRPQTVYRRLILRSVKSGEVVTVAQLKTIVRENVILRDADWSLKASDPRKVIWLERLHGAIHNLVRVGLLARTGPGQYRRGSAP